jgi:hypothetical protein
VNTSEYHWRCAFVAVLREVDLEKFATRLTVADDAVFQRLLELEGIEGTEQERIALEDTMQDIRLLRENSCHFRV